RAPRRCSSLGGSLFDLVRWLKHVDFVVGGRTEYDRGVKTFSAEGRLSQVECAIKIFH
ncbi:unnamed protein product, partial [Musa banksii]